MPKLFWDQNGVEHVAHDAVQEAEAIESGWLPLPPLPTVPHPMIPPQPPAPPLDPEPGGPKA